MSITALATAPVTASQGYTNQANAYIGMVPAETVRGERVSSAAMQILIDRVDLVPDDSTIHDASCGNGWNLYALSNLARDFKLVASDASQEMLAQTQLNAQSNGFNVETRLAKFDELQNITDWQGQADCVLMTNAASELFGDMPESAYDEHIVNSIIGAGSVLKDDGVILIDVRDWEKTLDLPNTTTRSNTHSNGKYDVQYDWNFSERVDGVHTAQTTITTPDAPLNPATNIIRFAGRTKEALTGLFKRAGFQIIAQESETRGNNAEPFNVFALRRI